MIYAAPRITFVAGAAFVELADEISLAASLRVQATAHRLTHPAIYELVPAYASLLIRYDVARLSKAALRRLLRSAVTGGDGLAESGPAGALVEIAVSYGGADGPDLAQVAAHCGLSGAAVIARHSAALYTVAMLGFAPGFAYLLGLPAALATPRLASPRPHVPAGSIGIAGQQSGLYALDTPAGWQIIGRTLAPLWQAHRQPPSLLQVGDRVRFVAQSAPEE